VWDASTEHDVFVYTGHSLSVKYAAWSPDGKRIASVGDDGTVQIWDSVSGQHVLRVDLQGPSGEQVAWSPDGTYIAVAEGNTVRVWDARRGGDPTNIYVSNNNYSIDAVHSVAWSPDGKRFAMGSYSYKNSTVRIWQTNNTSGEVYANGSSGRVERVAWSPNGKYVAFCGDDGGVHIWSITSST
jgi:WD40 repeat protein